MKLRVWLHRNSQQVPSMRVVPDDGLVNIGIEHVPTSRILSIGVHDDGTLTAIWSDASTQQFGDTMIIGKINDDGTSELHEPEALT